MAESSSENKKDLAGHKYKCTLCNYSGSVLAKYKRHMGVHSTEKPFKCPELNCPFKTKWEQNVKVHVKSIHVLESSSGVARPFPCSHSGCSYAAKEKFNLMKHLKIHSDEAPNWFCSHSDCNYATNFKQSLISHTRRHTGEKPFVCQFESCSYTTAYKSQLTVHTRTHTKEKPFKCPEPNCEYSAAQNSRLQEHQLLRHPKEGKERPSFQCPICEYSSKTASNLTKHIKRHTLEKLFKCEEPNCNFEAKTTQEIKLHKLSHSDEKPLVCPVESCEFRCKVKSNLGVHLKTHSGEKQYKCELCPFRGKTREVVRNHLQNVHSDPNFRPFKCKEPECHFASKRSGNLKAHLLIHEGEKRYSCSFKDCEYRAILESWVKRHQMQVHETEKKYACELCDYASNVKGSLIGHLRTHTKEAPFICKEKTNGCEYRAKTLSVVTKHEKSKHPHLRMK